MTDTVIIHLSSMLNISFNHDIDTGLRQDEWDEMSDREQAAFVTDLIFERAIDWSVKS
jgi:hypothetical protein